MPYVRRSASYGYVMARLALAFIVLLSAGCAASGGTGAGGTTSIAQQAAGEAALVTPPSDAPGMPQAPGASGGPAARTPPPMPRKIIYTAQVELLAEDLTAAEQELNRLVKTHGGYVAGTDMGGTPGSARAGQWRVRIPVEGFDAFMAAVVKLGELQRINRDSQDVSEEYYDVEARLSNKRVEEKRLLQHLQHSTARLQDILAVERELSRVREEIEQLQGRLRYLSNQTELTTITLNIQEAREYLPVKTTGFGAQVARTFRDSLGTLRDLGKGIILTVVALAPWLLMLAVIGLPVWIVLRRRAADRAGRGG